MKIYTSQQFNADRYVGMWLDFEEVDYTKVQDPAHADVKINAGSASNLSLAIFHNHENQIQGIDQIASANCPVVTNIWYPELDNPHIIFNDLAWNYRRAYYSNYQFSPQTELWYYPGAEYFNVPEHSVTACRTHIYLSPGNIHNRTRRYRTSLADFLNKHPAPGFRSPLVTQTGRPYPGQGIYPIHSDYYLNSFISIYGETIEFGLGTVVTEKTWDTLIRGHFILPFSNAGFIAYLTTQGVKFPSWIDYSYDSILDDDLRYYAYQHEIGRVLEWELDVWQTCWANDFDIIQHNQRLVTTRPYHKTGILSLVDR